MGIGFDLKCKSCDYGVSILEGIGMAHYHENIFPKFIPKYLVDDVNDGPFSDYDMSHGRRRPLLFEFVRSKQILKETREMLNKGADVGEYGHALYDCPGCHRIFNKFHYKLILGDEEYEPDHECSHCRKVLKRAAMKIDDNDVVRMIYVDGGESDWHCPNCGGDVLMNSGGFLWD
jgi:DNA-directed RNA polymerase subunit RPC12/RpoP